MQQSLKIVLSDAIEKAVTIEKLRLQGTSGCLGTPRNFVSQALKFIGQMEEYEAWQEDSQKLEVPSAFAWQQQLATI